MKLKLPLLVAGLLVALLQFTASAQNGCVPTGVNASPTQLNFFSIGSDFQHTVEDYARYKLLDENIVFDQLTTPVEFNFTNTTGTKMYMGMYLDLDQDGSYDPITEKIYSASTSLIEYNDVITLTPDILNALKDDDIWFRLIISADGSSLENPCVFPGLFTPYQVFETKTSRIKITRTTAQNSSVFPGGGCYDSSEPLSVTILVENIGNADVEINNFFCKYQSDRVDCLVSELLSSITPDDIPLSGPDGEGFYYWTPQNPMNAELVGGGSFTITTSVAPDCWMPKDKLALIASLDYESEDLILPDPSDVTLYFDNLSLCGTGGGNAPDKRLAASTITDSKMQVYPNPSVDHISLELELHEQASVQINVIDILGNVQKSIDSGKSFTPGNHKLTISTTDLPTGVYFLNVFINNRQMTISKFTVSK